MDIFYLTLTGTRWVDDELTDDFINGSTNKTAEELVKELNG